MMLEYIDVLDSQGSKKGYTKLRTDELEYDEYARVIHVWIKNEKGLYLVQQRADCKKVDPNLWSITAGFVNAHETMIDTVRRELMEELSYDLDESKLIHICTEYPTSPRRHIAEIFLLNENISLDEVMAQTEEVQAVCYMSKEEILEGVEVGSFNDFNNMYDGYYDRIFEVI